MKTTTLKIDDEFSLLMQPSSPQTYNQLSANLLKNGCHHPITVWQNTVIDKIEHYKICSDKGINFDIHNVFFNNRAEVIAWICSKQLQQQHLNADYRRYLIGKLYTAEKDIDLNSSPDDGHYSSLSFNSVHNGTYKVAGALGEQFHLHTCTILKYDVNTNNIDRIASKCPEMARGILTQYISISQENTMKLARLPQKHLTMLYESIKGTNMECISYATIKKDFLWKNLGENPFSKAPAESAIPIKQMPKPDPDAAFSSLAFTVPSWISSLKRTLDNSDLHSVSPAARDKLKKQLLTLNTATINLLENITEEKNNG